MSVLLLRRCATRPIQSIPSVRFPSSLTALQTTTSTANPPPARRALARTLLAPSTPRPRSLSSTRPAPRAPAPTDPISPASLEYTTALEPTLQSLPALTTLCTAPNTADWYETRLHAALPDSACTHKLTIGALCEPGQLALFPLAKTQAVRRLIQPCA
ncbi:hypothetical protein B0H14DRAFT_3425540 [Mycena olivaceomarginata]|nr:hypothetical protein B0H14DRAFT_3425540 [Mycena olivaceomarginata]